MQDMSPRAFEGQNMKFTVGDEPSPTKNFIVEQIQHHYQLRLKRGDGAG